MPTLPTTPEISIFPGLHFCNRLELLSEIVFMIVDDLVEIACSGAHGRKIKDVRAGLGYTCVMLDDGSCGLAYTFRNQTGCCCGIIGDAGGLIGRNAEEIVSWAKDSHLLKASIGVATVNAVINNAHHDFDTGNVTTVLDVNPDDTLGMIGEFKPILHSLKDKIRKSYVFELNTAKGPGLYPSEAMPSRLPECSVVIITATSIINHTFDEVQSYCRNAREVCILGPSTTLCPAVFRRYHVTLLAGSIVREPEKALEIVSQGGGTMAMKPAVRQVLMRL